MANPAPKRKYRKAPKVQWTPKMFEKLVERYVFRNKISKNFREAISSMRENELVDRSTGLPLLKLLFAKRENEMRETYISPEDLMNDLFLYQNFPCNAEFLGLKNSLNYHALLIKFNARSRLQFCSILDAYVDFVRYLDECKFVTFLAKSIGNSIGRMKKNSFELVSFGIYKTLEEKEQKIREELRLDDDFQHNTIEEVIMFFSEYYADADNETLAKMKKMLYDENKQRPVAQNLDHYENICRKIAFFDVSIRNAFITSPLAEKGLIEGKIPSARFFFDEKLLPRFFLAKELLHALEIACKNVGIKVTRYALERFVEIETEQERKLGILKTVTVEKYGDILSILKLPPDRIHIVDYKIEKTSRENQVPINSPYGNLCFLAKHAFYDLIQQVTVGMKFFRSAKTENILEFIEWFRSLDVVFSDSRNYVYFLEAWKVNELIEYAYNTFQKYTTEPIRTLTKLEYQRNDVMYELQILSPNFPEHGLLLSCLQGSLNTKKGHKFSARRVHETYEEAILYSLLELHRKYFVFLLNQGDKKERD